MELDIKRALRIGSKIIQSTAGSVLFVGTNGKLAQDNTNLFWNDVLNYLRTANIKGSDAASGTLTLESTSHATKGEILFGDSAYDEVTDSLGIGTTNPSEKFHVIGDSRFDGHIGIKTAPLDSAGVNYLEVFTDITANLSGAAMTAQYNPGAATGRNITGMNLFSQSQNGNIQNFTGNIQGFQATAQHKGTGTASSVRGATMALANTNTGTIIEGRVMNIGGVANSGGGTITTLKGLHIASVTAGTTNYAIYSQGGQSYHAGNFGINTAAPSEKLHVVGNVFIDTDSNKLILGAGKDMTAYYDGTDGHITTNDVAASDLLIACGTNKTLELQETVWKDIIIPAFALQIGSTSPDLVTFIGGGLKAYGFNGNATTESMHGTFEMQHDYKLETDITPHVHWSPSTANSGNVVWQFEYSWIDDDGTFGASTTITITDATDSTQWKHLIANFSAVSGTGHDIDSVMVWRIFRDPTNGSDTYTDDAILLNVGLHYEANTIGSRQVFVK